MHHEGSLTLRGDERDVSLHLLLNCVRPGPIPRFQESGSATSRLASCPSLPRHHVAYSMNTPKRP